MQTYALSPTRWSRRRYDPFEGLFSSFGAADPGPRYNVEQLEDDRYRIVLAVPGWREEDLDVTQREDEIVITGTAPADHDNVTFLHRGLGNGSFKRRFVLAEGVRATGASLDGGILQIDLVREVPEALKPRTIAIAPPAKRKAA